MSGEAGGGPFRTRQGHRRRCAPARSPTRPTWWQPPRARRPGHRSGQPPERACISDGQLAELAGLLRRVEMNYYGSRRTSSGAWRTAGCICRSPAPYYHPPKWTRDESAERFPNVITPLTWTSWKRASMRAGRDYSFRLAGLPGVSREMSSRALGTTSTATRMPCASMPVGRRSISPRWRICFARCPAAGGVSLGAGGRGRPGCGTWTGVDPPGRLSAGAVEKINEAELWAHVKEVARRGLVISGR